MKREFPKDRPPPLKITRPSDPHHHQQHQLLQQQQEQQRLAHPHPHVPFRPPNPHHRQPVIIHTYSPEVIRIESDKFRQLVQRLTGPAGNNSSGSSPPPPKRARVSVPPGNPNPNYGSAQGSDSIHPSLIAPAAPGHPRSQYLNPQLSGSSDAPYPYQDLSSSLPHNPLLSPSMFNFSPSVLPSPSTFSFDFSQAMASPTGVRAGGAGIISPGGALSLVSPRGWATPRSLAAVLPSPGPLSAGFLADLPVLSPAAYSWIEKNAASADAIASRAAGEGMFTASRPMMSLGLPPRPPPTTTANLFPVEEDKPSLNRETL